MLILVFSLRWSEILWGVYWLPCLGSGRQKKLSSTSRSSKKIMETYLCPGHVFPSWAAQQLCCARWHCHHHANTLCLTIVNLQNLTCSSSPKDFESNKKNLQSKIFEWIIKMSQFWAKGLNAKPRNLTTKDNLGGMPQPEAEQIFQFLTIWSIQSEYAISEARCRFWYTQYEYIFMVHV